MFVLAGSLKAEIPDEDTWDESPKIKEVAEGPYYDQFDYNVTRNYTVIAGTPAELLCRVKLKATDGNKTVSHDEYQIFFKVLGSPTIGLAYLAIGSKIFNKIHRTGS